MYQLNLISTMVADLMAKCIPGVPTENRVLIISPKDVNTTKSGIIIPGQVKEGVPRKGVVLIQGEITEDYKTYKELTTKGKVVTYGLYAGKELEFDLDLFPEQVHDIVKNSTFSVLSMSEVIYSEPNMVG
jgi:co-chaperonin GroES (HSP10)